jgi:hypothetical protein
MPTVWRGIKVSDLRDLLQTCLTIIFPFAYPLFVIFLALYLNLAFNVAGILTVSVGIVPVIIVWAKIMHKREAESLQARTEGFKTSPERQSQALEEYVKLVQDNHEEEQ